MVQSRSLSSHFSRRRFLQSSGGALGAATLGSSFLAACAGTGGSTNNSLPSLTQWYHSYGETGTRAAVSRYAKAYTKADVAVNWIPGTADLYPGKLQTALLGSKAPDVFELQNVSLAQVKAGLVESLDDIISSVQSDFLAASLAPYTVNGHVYAIPMIGDPQFIYYRKSLFKAAGITTTPTTFDELMATAKKLTTGSRKGLYIGNDGGVTSLTYPLLWTISDLISPDNKIIFNTQAVADSYTKLYDLNKSGSLLIGAPTDWTDPSAFEQGLAAMQWCGLWAMPGITKALGDDFAIFPLPPVSSQGKPATIAGGWAEAISAKGKNVAAAKAYVKYLWLDTVSVQTDWNVGYGFHVPPRKSIAAQTTKLEAGQAAVAVNILNQYGHSKPPLWDAAMDTALTGAVSNIIKNGGNALTQLNQAATQCTKELQQLLS
jgi:multiple sugar transport system substrate-binding protein